MDVAPATYVVSYSYEESTQGVLSINALFVDLFQVLENRFGENSHSEGEQLQ